MLYFILGQDGSKHIENIITDFKSKNTSGMIFTFDEDNFNDDSLKELIDSQNIFNDHSLVILRGLTDRLVDNFNEMKKNDNLFVVWELEYKDIDKISDQFDKVIISNPSKKTKDSFNIFSLQDAVGERDRKKLWLLYHQALDSGLEAEEIFWHINKPIRNILLLSLIDKKEKTDLHPFVIKKTNEFKKNFSIEDLKELLFNMTKIHIESRLGKIQLETSLEKFILTI